MFGAGSGDGNVTEYVTFRGAEMGGNGRLRQ